MILKMLVDRKSVDSDLGKTEQAQLPLWESMTDRNCQVLTRQCQSVEPHFAFIIIFNQSHLHKMDDFPIYPIDTDKRFIDRERQRTNRDETQTAVTSAQEIADDATRR